MQKFSVEDIEYDLESLLELDYTVQKMSEYLRKVGVEKAVRSQKFIRHLHLHIGLKIQKELNLPRDNILFEAKLKNKNVDIVITENNDPKFFITIRSQSSSIKKNFTNNINSLQGEVVSLKTFYPNCKVGLVYLLKIIDIDTKDDCTEYYSKNIPKKLLPLINTNTSLNNCFDAALLVIWDVNDKGNVIIDNKPDFVKAYDETSFIKDIKDKIQKVHINSQFSLSDLNVDKAKEFLGGS